MLLRLGEIVKNMDFNLNMINEIQHRENDTKNLVQLEQIFNEMTGAGTRCKDANQMILELTSRYHQIFILGGCYGKIEIKNLTVQKMNALKKLKQSLLEIDTIAKN